MQSSQQVLAEAITAIIGDADHTRLVFTGGWAGGFAAMYFSSLFSNSVAVAVNPQVDLFRYLRDSIPSGVKGAC